MKKILKLSVVWCLVISIIMAGNTVAFAQQTFGDLDASHWAYNSIIRLVDDGTVNGYYDELTGEYSFKPEETVTRAEFVKMIGEGPTMRANKYYDVDESHWAYGYIMTSGMKEDGSNRFFPDRAIKRGEVAEILWTRGGAVNGVVAPSAITDQYKTNPDAIAWMYTYGLMQGDDGVNLRLSDTLTRAEAAALIVRSRNVSADSEKKDFISSANSEILKTVFNSTKVFENEYSADTKVAYGEFARAAIKLATGENMLTYKGYSAVEEFEHKYAKDMYAIGTACLGNEVINAEYADKNVTVQDGLAMLVHAAIKNSAYPVGYGAKDASYADVTGTLNDKENAYLTYAFKNGIRLYANDKIDATREITHKDIACILLQLDKKMGLIKSKVTDKNNKYRAERIRMDMESYPSNAAEYRYILESVPNEIYLMPVTSYGKVESTRQSVFALANEYSYIFESTLESYRLLCQKNGADARFTYYPSLVYDNGNGYTMRVKCEITGTPVNVYMQDMFAGDYGDNYKVYNGMTFFMDVVTGGPVTDIVIDTDKVKVDKMVAILE